MQNIILSPSDIERFWKYVDKGDMCWIWIGESAGNPHHKNNLYGRLGIMSGEEGQRKQIHLRAHRISFYLAHGRWPVGIVIHSCDNPLCVNPAHLSEGTHKENTADMTRKGRSGGRFEKGHAGIKGNTRITQEIADRIRAEHVPHKPGAQAPGETSIKGLARKYGISKRTVQFILQGKYWDKG